MGLKRNHLLMLSMMAFCVSVAGCGGAGSDQPDLGLVKGVISFEGQPLPGASVTFMPVSGRPASAKTDDAGYYELVYIRNTPGCKTGMNKVVITSMSEGEDEMELEGDDVLVDTTKPVKEKVPARYNVKTELKVDVKPGENNFDFDLKK